MKRIFLKLMIAICCMVSCNMVANAGNDKPISVNALPAKAQTLLSQHFNGQKVMHETHISESGIDISSLSGGVYVAVVCSDARYTYHKIAVR